MDDPDPILSTLDMASAEDPGRFDREFDRAIAQQIFQKAAGNSTHSRYLLARFRKSFPRNLRKEVKDLVGPGKGEIDAEIRHLISVFVHAKP